MYQVPASRSSVVQFVMTCPGMSHSSTFTLHMRDSGEVDDDKVWGDLCREKVVIIAYNNDGIEVKNGKMDRVPPVKPVVKFHSAISHNWETLDIFFRKLIKFVREKRVRMVILYGHHRVQGLSETNCFNDLKL